MVGSRSRHTVCGLCGGEKGGRASSRAVETLPDLRTYLGPLAAQHAGLRKTADRRDAIPPRSPNLPPHRVIIVRRHF